jgi:hypothetical protein
MIKKDLILLILLYRFYHNLMIHLSYSAYPICIKYRKYSLLIRTYNDWMKESALQMYMFISFDSFFILFV